MTNFPRPSGAVIYLTVILILMIVICLMSPTMYPSFCELPKESGAVCIRNWLAGAGNILAFAGAGAAAVFAYRQIRHIQQQADFAMLPYTERRSEELREGTSAAFQVSISASFYERHCADILTMSHAKFVSTPMILESFSTATKEIIKTLQRATQILAKLPERARSETIKDFLDVSGTLSYDLKITLAKNTDLQRKLFHGDTEIDCREVISDLHFRIRRMNDGISRIQIHARDAEALLNERLKRIDEEYLRIEDSYFGVRHD